MTKFGPGDTVVATMSKTKSVENGHSITAGKLYTIQNTTGYHVLISKCDLPECSGRCQWMSVRFSLDIPITEEEAKQAVALPSPEDAASFVGRSKFCREVLKWDGGEIYCFKPKPCPVHKEKS